MVGRKTVITAGLKSVTVGRGGKGIYPDPYVIGDGHIAQ